MSGIAELMETLDDPRRLHAAAVHAPIVLAGLAPIFAGAGAAAMLRGGGPPRTLRWLTVLTFAAVMVLGFVASETGKAAEARLGEIAPEAAAAVDEHHERGELVWAFAAVGLVAAGLAWLPRRGHALAATAAAGLIGLAGLGWVITTAHHGGQLVYVYGLGTPNPVTEAQLRGEAASDADAFDDPRAARFVAEVRPLLAERCFGCHTSDRAEAALDMTSARGLLAGGLRGPAVVPGDPEASLLIASVRGEADDLARMPMSARALPARELAVLERWIADGAVWHEPAGPRHAPGPSTSSAQTGR